MGSTVENTERFSGVTLPLYPQLLNACGLASVLMVFDLPHDPPARSFLHQLGAVIYPLIYPILPDKTLEFVYQYVLQYLLLKAQCENPEYVYLTEYLQQRCSTAFDDQRTVFKYHLTLKQKDALITKNYELVQAYERFINQPNLVSEPIMRNEVVSMKSDIELKILMEIFGYRFISVDSPDGTGAIICNSKNLHTHWSWLQKVFGSSSYRVIYGRPNHWMAGVGIIYPDQKLTLDVKSNSAENIMEKNQWKDVVFIYNDPMQFSKNSITLREMNESHRLYVFQNQETEREKLWRLLYRSVSHEILTEIPDYEHKKLLNPYPFYDPLIDPMEEMKKKSPSPVSAPQSPESSKVSKKEKHIDDFDSGIDFDFT